MFISKNKKQINLPVPLDTDVWTFHTTCKDICYSHEKEFKKEFPDATCNTFSPCHTNLIGIKPVTLNLSNLAFILPNWGTLYFSTEEEALTAGKQLIENHIAILKEKGCYNESI